MFISISEKLMSNSPVIDEKKMKKVLIARKKELLTIISIGEENSINTELDQQRVGRLSRMDAIQLQAMEKETNRRRELELKRINSALKRIQSKDYGYCMACDEPIANERLENDPATPLCVNCAEVAR